MQTAHMIPLLLQPPAKHRAEFGRGPGRMLVALQIQQFHIFAQPDQHPQPIQFRADLLVR